MGEAAIVLDAGVIDQVTTNREFRGVVRRLVDRGYEAVVPTVVLAEAVTGCSRDAATNQAVKRFGTVGTDEVLARRAGALRHRARASGERRPPSAIDAIVAAHALAAGRSIVFTTDPDDLERLLAGHPGVRVGRP